MRVFAITFLCLLSSVAAAKPSRYPPVTQYNGDKIVGHAQLGPDVTNAIRCPPPACSRGRARGRTKTAPRAPRYKGAPVPAPRPGVVAPLTMAGGAVREVTRAAAVIVGGRPAGCPHRFCGCALAIKLFGKIVPHLNLAANWMRFPRAAPAPGMVAARRGHVFKLLAHIGGTRWTVWDPNSGRGRIRIHPRSIAGYVIVNPRAG